MNALRLTLFSMAMVGSSGVAVSIGSWLAKRCRDPGDALIAGLVATFALGMGAGLFAGWGLDTGWPPAEGSFVAAAFVVQLCLSPVLSLVVAIKSCYTVARRRKEG